MEHLFSPIQPFVVLVGVVFIIAVLSLLVSVLMETITLLFNFRAKMLMSAIQELLQNDKKLFQEFIRHPRFRQIVGASAGQSNIPQYLTQDSFADIFLEVLLLRGLELPEKEATLSSVTEFDAFLKARFAEYDRDIPNFKYYLEVWYSEKMDFASEKYKRQVKLRLFFVALFVAVLFNADIIGIYSRISSSLNTSPIEMVGTVTQNLEKLLVINPALKDSMTVKNIELKLLDIMDKSLDRGESTDVLGYAQITEHTVWNWSVRITGYLVSALLLSYAAQFWFSVLPRIVSIRGARAPAMPAPAAPVLVTKVEK